MSDWIPALGGVREMLQRGTRVADVGCGHGASTLVMAQAFPNSTFSGFDYHPASIERARDLAREAGVADRVKFEVGGAKSYPGTYDFVTFFDCLDDMGDPAGAARRVFESLTADGVWMLVEPLRSNCTGSVRAILAPITALFTLWKKNGGRQIATHRLTIEQKLCGSGFS